MLKGEASHRPTTISAFFSIAYTYNESLPLEIQQYKQYLAF